MSGGNGNATNSDPHAAGTAAAGFRATAVIARAACRRHLCTRFVFSPCAKAIAATDAPETRRFVSWFDAVATPRAALLASATARVTGR